VISMNGPHALIHAIHRWKLVEIGTLTTPKEGHRFLPHRIDPSHVYMILGYDRATQRFHLLNPYDDPSDDGKREEYLTWQEIMNEFDTWGSVRVAPSTPPPWSTGS